VVIVRVPMDFGIRVQKLAVNRYDLQKARLENIEKIKIRLDVTRMRPGNSVQLFSQDLLSGYVMDS
jgi:hypothetical protein